MTHFTLQLHGDSRQRNMAERVNRRCPHYEPFWREHIVPLSFRVLEEGNYFVRPQLKKPFIELADCSYAVFMHLTGALRWSEQLLVPDRDPKWRPTDAAYYFFSHIYSLLEACGSFADAVNRVLEKMKQHTVFVAYRADEQSPWRMEESAESQAGRYWRRLEALAKPYRNCLVHEKPLIFQNGLMPVARKTSIRELSGLTAISRLALNDGSILPQTEKVSVQISTLVDLASQLVDELCKSAREQLNAIEPSRYEHARRPTPDERRLTLKKILAARNF